MIRLFMIPSWLVVYWRFSACVERVVGCCGILWVWVADFDVFVGWIDIALR